MILNLFGNEYTYAPSAAFSANVNYLSQLRGEIRDNFPSALPDGWEAQIRKIVIKAAAAFSASFNNTDTVEASQNAAGEYEISFRGAIARVVFSASVTAESITLYWSRAPKNHFDVTIALPTGTALSSVTDGRGNEYVKNPDGSFELSRGLVYVTASGGGYEADGFPVVITGAKTAAALISPVMYTVLFSVTPEGAKVTVKDKNGSEILPVLGNPNEFLLANSTAAGNYSYTVSAPGYVDKTGSLTVSADSNVTAALLWDISESGDGSVGASVSGGALTISGSGAMRNFSESSPAPWKGEGADIASVSVSAAVSKIGAYAFWGLSAVTSLTLGGVGNAVSSIGENALLDTTALSSCTVYTAGGAALSGDPFGALVQITYSNADAEG